MNPLLLAAPLGRIAMPPLGTSIFGRDACLGRRAIVPPGLPSPDAASIKLAGNGSLTGACAALQEATLSMKAYSPGAAAVILAFSFVACFAAETPKPAPRLDETSLRPMISQGIVALKAGRPSDALKLFDQVDQVFSTAYTNGPAVYCSRGPQETVLYMTMAAARREPAITISPRWCDAIYLKAYSLIDLKRPVEAASEIDRVLKMAPENSQYLNERAQLHVSARQFDTALALFQRAEEHSALTPDAAVARVFKSRACRGIGYVLTEQGKLDESEATYLRCLGVDPDDQKSKNELAYIAKLKGGKK